MAVFKCKMCGGTIECSVGDTVGVCDSCGIKQTLPILLNDERRANFYNRANQFRRNNEFDKAESIYEQLLNDNDKDPEVYWSLVLCRYGIEYVEDPGTHKRVPTVNRMQYTSVLNDEDYKLAIKYSDTLQRGIYEDEAVAINEIQKGILAISRDEEPFDIFICYKETDSNGRRTPDSVLANDIYYQLTGEGYRVFFSRISLENVLGAAYEPYIFAALNSAKVMIVLGTRVEYFNAVWVKNEWSRYLSLVKQSKGTKTLIPAYRDLDPYDLPEEFSHLQALDMSRIGFIQDLLHGVKKIIGRKESNDQASENRPYVYEGRGTSIVSLLRKASIALESGFFEEASKEYDKILDVDGESADAYIGMMMASLKVRNLEKLRFLDEPLDQNMYYNRVMRYADEQLVAKMKEYNAATHSNHYRKVYDEKADHIGEAINREAAIIRSSNKTKEVVDAISNLEERLKELTALKESERAKEVAKQCRELIQEGKDRYNDIVYDEAFKAKNRYSYNRTVRAKELFHSISGWRDADDQAVDCEKILRSIDRRVLIALVALFGAFSIGIIALKCYSINNIDYFDVNAVLNEKLTLQLFLSKAWYILVFLLVMNACAVAFYLIRKIILHDESRGRQEVENAKQILRGIRVTAIVTAALTLFFSLPKVLATVLVIAIIVVAIGIVIIQANKSD